MRHGVRSPDGDARTAPVLYAGFPEPEVNAALTDLQGGWLAEGDLVWRMRRVVGEYQGQVHADRGRASLDAFRRGLLEDNRWQVKDIWSEDPRRGPRRRTTLMSFAGALDLLDPATLVLGLIGCRRPVARRGSLATDALGSRVPNTPRVRAAHGGLLLSTGGGRTFCVDVGPAGRR